MKHAENMVKLYKQKIEEERKSKHRKRFNIRLRKASPFIFIQLRIGLKTYSIGIL